MPSKKVCGCGRPMHHSAAMCVSCRYPSDGQPVAHSAAHNPTPLVQPTPAEHVQFDRARKADAEKIKALEAKYREAQAQLRQYEERADWLELVNRGIDTFKIAPKQSSGTAEGTVVVAASDWHIEEKVTPAQTDGLNEATLAITKKRATKFFQSSLRLTQLLRQDCNISNMVMGLLGDFITNDIHEEFPENNQLLPMDAMLEVEGWIISGIQFLLDESDLQLTFPCHSGNHARTTADQRYSTEHGHSLEYYMYNHIAKEFRNNPRCTFVIPQGLHSYVEVYNRTIRFHHGHAIRYQGGVGGIFIPAFKKIAQWNKARHADLDIFGHFHQTKDGGNFLSNGSLIGYNSYALSGGFDYEKPQQTLTLFDKRRGRTCVWPILLES